MVSCVTAQVWTKRLACFALVGFAFIVLAGPVLSLLVTAAVFGLIGFLVWLPLHTVFVGPKSAWCKTFRGGSRVTRKFKDMCVATENGCRGIGTKVAEWWPPVRGFVRESSSGAAVALGVVLLAGVDGPGVLIASLIGGLAGAVVGVAER